MKCNAGKKEDQKLHQGDINDVLPHLLKPMNAVQGNKCKTEEQKPKLGENKVGVPNIWRYVEKCKAIDKGKTEEQKPKLGENKVDVPNIWRYVEKCKAIDKDLASQLYSPKSNSSSTTKAAMKP